MYMLTKQCSAYGEKIKASWMATMLSHSADGFTTRRCDATAMQCTRVHESSNCFYCKHGMPAYIVLHGWSIPVQGWCQMEWEYRTSHHPGHILDAIQTTNSQMYTTNSHCRVTQAKYFHWQANVKALYYKDMYVLVNAFTTAYKQTGTRAYFLIFKTWLHCPNLPRWYSSQRQYSYPFGSSFSRELSSGVSNASCSGLYFPGDTTTMCGGGTLPSRWN